MRATKEFFNEFRLEIEQGVNVPKIKDAKDITIEALRKQIHDLEVDNDFLRWLQEGPTQSSQSQPQETVQNESEIICHCLNELIDSADALGKESLDKLYAVISDYSLNHNHLYDAQIQKAKAKIAEKGKTQFNVDKVDNMTVSGDFLGDNAQKQVNNYNKQLQ